MELHTSRTVGLGTDATTQPTAGGRIVCIRCHAPGIGMLPMALWWASAAAFRRFHPSGFP